jgi:hypothetical protein
MEADTPRDGYPRTSVSSKPLLRKIWTKYDAYSTLLDVGSDWPMPLTGSAIKPLPEGSHEGHLEFVQTGELTVVWNCRAHRTRLALSGLCLATVGGTA